MILRLLTAVIACAFITATPLSAKEKTLDEATKKAIINYPIVNVKTIGEEMIHAFMEGEVENIILEFSEGTLIPFKTSLSGNIINILPKERDPIYFSIQQTFYLAITNDDTLFSTDLSNWMTASSFFHGDIGFNIDTTAEGPAIRLSGELQHEKSTED
jgi:hypothetical protein